MSDATTQHTPETWDIAARAYLDRLGAAEYMAFLAGKRKKADRYSPSEYHRSLIEMLNADNEEGFKAIKMLRGRDSALGV